MSNQSINVSYTSNTNFTASAASQRQFALYSANPSFLRYSYLTQDSLTLVYYTASVVIPITSLWAAALSASSALTYAPVIVTQPVSQTVTHPSTAYMTVSASAETALTYQWWYQSGSGAWSSVPNTGIYTGSASPALTSSTTNVATQNTASYFCLVSNVVGSTSSSVAILNVI